jgi:hypothetical protein
MTYEQLFTVKDIFCKKVLKKEFSKELGDLFISKCGMW